MRATITRVYGEPQNISINGGYIIYHVLVQCEDEVGNNRITDIIRHSKEDIDKVEVGYEFELRGER